MRAKRNRISRSNALRVASLPNNSNTGPQSGVNNSNVISINPNNTNFQVQNNPLGMLPNLNQQPSVSNVSNPNQTSGYSQMSTVS